MKISKREFLRKAAGTALAVALPGLGLAVVKAAESDYSDVPKKTFRIRVAMGLTINRNFMCTPADDYGTLPLASYMEERFLTVLTVKTPEGTAVESELIVLEGENHEFCAEFYTEKPLEPSDVTVDLGGFGPGSDYTVTLWHFGVEASSHRGKGGDVRAWLDGTLLHCR